MNLSEILSLCNYVANKEKLGNTLTPEQYNILLEAVNADFFRKEYEDAQKIAFTQGVRLGSVIFKSGALRGFRYKEDDVTVTAGVITVSALAETYVYWISMMATYNGARRGVEFVSDVELEDRLTNLLAKPIEYFPAAIDNGSEILVYPADITAVDFVYLKMPTQPVYAWTQDAYDRTIYSPEGSTELEWAEIYHPQIVQEILSRIGISLKSEQLQAYVERARADSKIV
jgi:hypothetical protein